jgi:hypothetical protein
MTKLTRTGQWLWRDGELSTTTYYKLTIEEKIEHINFLLSLKENELSSNDRIILNFAGKIVKSKKNNFFSMEETIPVVKATQQDEEVDELIF